MLVGLNLSPKNQVWEEHGKITSQWETLPFPGDQD